MYWSDIKCSFIKLIKLVCECLQAYFLSILYIDPTRPDSKAGNIKLSKGVMLLKLRLKPLHTQRPWSGDTVKSSVLWSTQTTVTLLTSHYLMSAVPFSKHLSILHVCICQKNKHRDNLDFVFFQFRSPTREVSMNVCAVSRQVALCRLQLYRMLVLDIYFVFCLQAMCLRCWYQCVCVCAYVHVGLWGVSSCIRLCSLDPKTVFWLLKCQPFISLISSTWEIFSIEAMWIIDLTGASQHIV